VGLVAVVWLAITAGPALLALPWPVLVIGGVALVGLMRAL
jgi:hypothetical protein